MESGKKRGRARQGEDEETGVEGGGRVVESADDVEKDVRLRSMADALTATTATIDREDMWTVLTDTLSKFHSVKRGRLEDTTDQSIERNESRDSIDLLPGEILLSDQSNLNRDFVLKTSARFISQSPMNWCKNPSAAAECGALQDFLTLKDISDPERLFAAGLYYYRYPEASTLPPSFAKSWQNVVPVLYHDNFSVPTSDAEKTEVTRQRVSDWEQALRSLYYRWRYGYAPWFYVLLPTQMILFGKGPSGDLCVAMTRSTPGQRATLDEMGVQYSAPLLAGRGGVAGDTVQEKDRSLLLFSTTVDAHGLYDFLMALGPRFTSAADVPTLLSEFGFRGAQLCTLSIDLLQEQVRGVSSNFSHVLEVSGPILPTNLRRLSSALLKKLRSFEAHLSNDERCMGVNAFVTDGESREVRPFSFAASAPGSAQTSGGAAGAATSPAAVQITNNTRTTSLNAGVDGDIPPSNDAATVAGSDRSSGKLSTTLGTRFLTRIVARNGSMSGVASLQRRSGIGSEQTGPSLYATESEAIGDHFRRQNESNQVQK